MKHSPLPSRLALAALPALALSACSQMGVVPSGGNAGSAQGTALQQCETLSSSA